jgi:hypothetical protein
MKRYVAWVGILLLAGTLVSCGGGGGGGSSPAPANAGTPDNNGGNPPNTGGTPPTPPVTDTSTRRFEEKDTTFVTRSGVWGDADPHGGWSDGKALESTDPNASITFSFTGTSVRWIGGRGRNGGKARVLVDGAQVKIVDLFYRPNDEFRAPCFTVYDLTPGPHTLTIQVLGEHNPLAAADSPNKVWVDAFEVNPLVVSRLQEVDPAVSYAPPGAWTLAPESLTWSGGGARNDNEPHIAAQVTETPDATVTLDDKSPNLSVSRNLNVRGTSISWVGYRGPDGGIAKVSVDGGPEATVDTYAAVFKLQEVLFTASGLEDKPHTLRIRATGEKNPKSTAAKIYVDAFEVAKPGKRFEDDSPSVAFAGVPGVGSTSWDVSNSRDWSEGWSHTNSHAGASVTFNFNGTSVSWIGCEKATIGKAKVFLDDQPPVEINMNTAIEFQGFQRTVFRKDGLTKGPHTLTIVVSSTDGNFVVVDAFDVVE